MDKEDSYNQPINAGKYLEAVFEAATDAIITICERGIIEKVNPAAERLFGYQAKELIGQNVSVLMPSPHRERHDHYLQHYMEGGKPKIIGIGREVEAICKNGKLIPIRLAVSEVVVGQKHIFAGILHDLTEEKKSEAKIRKLNEELEQKVKQRTEELVDVVNKLLQANQQLSYENRERQAAEDALRKSEIELRKSLQKEKDLSQLKSRFVTMASHEFRTPLSAILSSADLIELYSKQPDAEGKRMRHVARIKAAVNNLTNILNDFLSLSKLEEDRVQVQTVSFRFTEFCNEVSDELRGLLKPGQVIRHPEGIPDEEVKLDKKILKNILYNLLSNAIKYSEPGKPIDCKINLENNNVILEIKDYGIGIPKEDQQHLFTRFFRAHNAENIQGTGLGLNIVRKYLDLLDGDIDFESELGKGTTFIVRIPVARESE